MQFNGMLDFLPLWLLFVITVGVALIAIEIGFRIGNYRRERSQPEKEGPVSAVVGATLGLLAFMLAFTFGLAATRFEDRTKIVGEEANTIGTTYLRAELLPEPYQSQIRGLLRDYVDVRLEAIQRGKLDLSLARSNELQGKLWSLAVANAALDTKSIPSGLFIEALNEMIDIHSRRVFVGVRNRIPGVIWLTLYLISMLAMGGMGYQEGLASAYRTLVAPGLVLTFSLVMVLIADLDRPQEGFMRVSQQAMLDLKASVTVPTVSSQRKGS